MRKCWSGCVGLNCLTCVDGSLGQREVQKGADKERQLVVVSVASCLGRVGKGGGGGGVHHLMKWKGNSLDRLEGAGGGEADLAAILQLQDDDTAVGKHA